MLSICHIWCGALRRPSPGVLRRPLRSGGMKVLAAVAWPYANGPRHIGHVAGFGVPSDVFSRWARMAGHDVLMVSGSDEHGTPILVQADAEGVSPTDLVDRNHRLIAQDLVALGLSYDLYTRTTTVNHHQVVQELFSTAHANGYLVERTTMGAVSAATGRTLPDRYVEGTCPICGYGSARGDQCDSCGNQLDPVDLVDPRSRIDGQAPRFVESQHLFLDLPALAGALGAWLEGREASGTWRPNVLAFSQNLLGDVRPRAMTRDIDWGIAVPVDGWRDLPTKRLYVWFDAVVGYLSASVERARRSGDPESWRTWWDGSARGEDAPRSCYFMGKDNITFHSQIWPAELLAYDGRGERGGAPGRLGELALPTEVVSSEFLTMEGGKFSSSRGVVIYVRDVLERYQVDALRYYIVAAGPESHDADFTWSEFVRRTDDELVSTWGNLVNRTASMIAKNLGAIPPAGTLGEQDRALLDAVAGGFEVVGALISAHRQKQAIGEAMRLAGATNRYLSDNAPWKLAKGGDEDRARMATVLHVAAQAVSDLNTLLSPFLPHSSTAVHQALGGTGTFQPMPVVQEVTDLDDPDRAYPVITGDYSGAPAWAHRPVVPGTPVAPPKPIFTKLDEAVVEEELARLRGE